MERKGPHHIPLDVLHRRLGNKLSPEEREARLQQISAVRTDVHGVLQQTRERSGRLDVDSHASRIEARNELSFVEGFYQKIARAKPGSVVYLTKTIIDEGYDPEEAAEFQAAGLEYETAADRAEGEYAMHLHAVNKFLPRLENAGVSVKVGFKRIPPDVLPTGSDKMSEEA